jgi:uncharacterized protein (DUF1501 family)
MKSNRRDFIKQGGALVSASALPFLSSLSAIGEASAATANDYKALVCIFLTGGNDSYNALIPLFDADHQTYRSKRPNFYINRYYVGYGGDDGTTEANGNKKRPTTDLVSAPIPPAFQNLQAPSKMALGCLGANQNPRRASVAPTPPYQNPAAHNVYGLSPSLSSLWPLYEEGVLAPILNVGSITEPITAMMSKTPPVLDYIKPFPPKTTTSQLKSPDSAAISIKPPPKLGSHNDQQMFWQSLTVEGGTQGWGGLMMGFTSPKNAGDGLKVESMLTAGNQVWSQGDRAPAYQAGVGLSLRSKFDTLDAGYKGNQLSNSIKPIMQGAPGSSLGAFSDSQLHPMRRDLMRVISDEFTLRSKLSDSTLNRTPNDAVFGNLTALAEPAESTLPADANSLAAQLRTVAHVIRNRSSLPGPPTRQVFFVSLGGFDTHSNTVGTHDKLLQHVAQAMLAFHRTLSDPAIDAANQVVTFTASDFGRTLSSNGDGTDHGWGAHHFVMGGDVKGGTVWGTPPPLGDFAKNLTNRLTDGPVTYADNGRGRLIPTISVDQYGATLAKWMGVTDTDLPKIFKNLPNFPEKTVPFL